MKKIFTLWRIITSNIMMMKKLLFSSFFLLGSLVSQAQHEYTIKGEVKGVKDGTHVSLFLTDGRVGSIVGTDTIRNGTFFFKRNAGESGTSEFPVCGKCFTASCKNFVAVCLMSHVPYNTVVWCIVDVVQSYG